jgi:DNA repair exonuclease SbcCD ATPase subunit
LLADCNRRSPDWPSSVTPAGAILTANRTSAARRPIMTAAALKPRVDTLEYALQVLAEQAARTAAEVERLSLEMREFKDEMGEFKNEMSEFKNEMSEFKNEMSEFKNEMSDFKNEMSDFKDETRREHRELNRKWGEMANKLGTIVEDLVAPSLPRVVHEVCGEEIIDLSLRRKRKLPDGRVQEFDAIAVTPSLVCLNSTKSTLRSADVDALVGEIDQLREFFPEFRTTPVIGILASLAVEDSVLRHASRQGFVVLAIGDELMEVRNPPGFVPRRW